jgi:hypothetical protein
MSRIDNATLQLTLTSATVSGGESAKVRVYAVNYNVLRIMSGFLTQATNSNRASVVIRRQCETTWCGKLLKPFAKSCSWKHGHERKVKWMSQWTIRRLIT